jgi:hypothetical protein
MTKYGPLICYLNVISREKPCYYLSPPVLGGSIIIRITRKVYERRDFTLYSRGSVLVSMGLDELLVRSRFVG